ncbi:MAG: YraN family protein [Gammaproteobacteria bacterium]
MLRARGTHFERLAETKLQNSGLRTLARNFSCRVGEIDLVMEDATTIVFVEVRYRNSAAFGGPLESITSAKQLRLVRAAQVFLQRHPAYASRECRFDAVGISGTEERPDICWIKSAFSA